MFSYHKNSLWVTIFVTPLVLKMALASTQSQADERQVATDALQVAGYIWSGAWRSPEIETLVLKYSDGEDEQCLPTFRKRVEAYLKCWKVKTEDFENFDWNIKQGKFEKKDGSCDRDAHMLAARDYLGDERRQLRKDAKDLLKFYNGKLQVMTNVHKARIKRNLAWFQRHDNTVMKTDAERVAKNKLRMSRIQDTGREKKSCQVLEEKYKARDDASCKRFEKLVKHYEKMFTLKFEDTGTPSFDSIVTAAEIVTYMPDSLSTQWCESDERTDEEWPDISIEDDWNQIGKMEVVSPSISSDPSVASVGRERRLRRLLFETKRCECL